MLTPLNPIRNLKGKLSHIRMSNHPILRIYELANSLRGTSRNQSILDEYSQNQLKSLHSLNKQVTKKSFHKLQLDLCAYNNPLYPIPTTTIYQPLPTSQKKLLKALQNYISKLNTRQTLYLNYKLRQLLNVQFSNWDNLHLNVDCPYRRDIMLLPLLGKVSNLYSLKTVNKIDVITAITGLMKDKQKKIAK